MKPAYWLPLAAGKSFAQPFIEKYILQSMTFIIFAISQYWQFLESPTGHQFSEIIFISDVMITIAFPTVSFYLICNDVT